MNKLSEKDGLNDFVIDRTPPTDRQGGRVPDGHDTEVEAFNATAIELAEAKMGVRIPEMFLMQLTIYQALFGGLIYEVITTEDLLAIFIIDNNKSVLEVAFDRQDYSKPPLVEHHKSWSVANMVAGAGDLWASLSETELNFLTNMPHHG